MANLAPNHPPNALLADKGKKAIAQMILPFKTKRHIEPN
jgi:hypothetical protein